MSNTVPLPRVIEDSIRQLLLAYGESPLRLMREIGIQAELHALLQKALPHDCAAQLRAGARRIIDTPYRVGRVQMEMKLQSASEPDGNVAAAACEKSDIVVLRSTADGARPVTLALAPNGHFDILSTLGIEDVAAVIEVKAACSSDVQQRHLFRKDVEKLLAVAGKAAIAHVPMPELHFVLVDKSVAIGSHRTSSKAAVHDFHEEPDVNQFSELGIKRFWEDSPRLALSSERPLRLPTVNVWSLGHDAAGVFDGRVVHRYASLSD